MTRYDHVSRLACELVPGKLLALLAAGCMVACQTAPPPDQMARTTLQTAPADLQLLCANAVATASKVDSSKVLPVSSSALDPQSFNVELSASGRKFNCVVDNKGVVKSVHPA